MKYCPSCGKEVSNTAKFCKHCRFDIQKYNTEGEATSEQQSHEKPQNTIGEVDSQETEEVAEEASGVESEPKVISPTQGEAPSTEQKKSPLPWIAAIVGVVVVGIVAAVLLLGQTSDESTGEPPVVIDIPDLGLSEPEDAPEPEPVEEQELGESALESESSFYGVTDEQFDREMGEARSDIEYYGRYADEFFPEEGFYGIWVSASRDRIEAERTLTQVLDRLFESEGLGAGLVTTSSWSNLNPDVWHAVCVGPFLSQAEAEEVLGTVRAAGYSDAYVKFSGAIR
ncbi:MAG: SPOR domain-containing protein [Coriobacteriia bacterium]|nr:SPOR domain-containing protein [Coriobacteriia bacterium]